MAVAGTMSEPSLNFFFDEFMSSNVSDFLSSFSFPTNFDPSSVHIPSSLLTPASVLEDSMLCIDHNMFINASECSWPSASCNGLKSSQAMCHFDDSSGSLMDHMCMPHVLDEQNCSSMVHRNEEILGNFDLIRQVKPEGLAKECADSEANKFKYTKRKLQILESSSFTVGSNNSTNHLSPVDINPKKKCRVPVNIPRSARIGNDSKNEEKAFATLGHSSCSYFSEDELNISSPELNGDEGSAIPSSKSSMKNGKTRANKVPATDPQSLYARKRRERINERLRILQNLVPNGTKVDISTMLEEAVQYVKFLQLQIKLLSSDDLWMYAPIAYNGMNIGLDFDTNLKPAL